jgi:cell division protein FtsB
VFVLINLGANTIGRFSTTRLRAIVPNQEERMRQYGVYEFDNRDSAQMYEYMEARIEALKRRIEQLETEIEVLRSGNFRGARYPVYVSA